MKARQDCLDMSRADRGDVWGWKLSVADRRSGGGAEGRCVAVENVALEKASIAAVLLSFLTGCDEPPLLQLLLVSACWFWILFPKANTEHRLVLASGEQGGWRNTCFEVDRMDELIWKTEQLPQYAANMQHIVLTITLSWIDLNPEFHYPSGKVNVIKWAPLRSSAPLSLSFLLLMQCLQAVPAQLYTALIKLYVIRVQSCYALTQTKYSLFQHKSSSLTLICLYTPMSQISISVKDFLS